MRSTDFRRLLASDHLPGLDFLRMVAVVSVLLVHLEIPNLAPLLFIDGVQLFFVISGFLITWLLLREFSTRQTIDMYGFYRRRAARLLPLFFVYLFTGYVVLKLRHQHIDVGAILSSLLYLTNYYQAMNGAPSHYLSHCWSLAVEEQFYLLWPLALVGLRASRIRLDVTLVVLIFMVWLLRPILMLGFGVDEVYLYRALETRADHLLVGCLLAVLLDQPTWQRRAEAAARHWWALPLTVISMALVSRWFGHDPALKFTLGFAIEPVLSALVIVFVLAKASGQSSTAALLRFPPLVLVGQISYGIYLMHPFVTQPVLKLVRTFTGSTPLAVIAALFASIALAYISFKFFETPVRVRLREGLTQRANAVNSRSAQ
jgi:peptidoglycan/LPS O-acetylase OafA/YrhL